MGVASLVLGIISIVIGFIPFCGIIALLPAIIGFILGLIDTILKAKRGESKGISIAGLVLSILAIIIMLFYFFIVGIGLSTYNTASNAISDFPTNYMDYTRYVGGSATVDDMKVKFVSVDTNFKDYYTFATVQSGYKILKADFEFENVDSTTSYVSSSDFNCYADDISCSSFYSVANSTFYSSVEPGRKARGSVYYEVPVDADEIEIVYDGNVWMDGKITFIVK